MGMAMLWSFLDLAFLVGWLSWRWVYDLNCFLETLLRQVEWGLAPGKMRRDDMIW